MTRRVLTAGVATILTSGLVLGVVAGVVAGAAPASAKSPAASAVHSSAGNPAHLTNLAHLDSLTTAVTPPAQAGHTTYRLAQQPAVGELWVYANHSSVDGSYTPVGGGTFDPASNTYAQGAYDADDVSRAAVVYLRHWRQFGDAHSRDEAYQLLRGLTYLQTATGPNAGNVVLWMQPDGTLNPSPTPVELPNPSDSGASYWLARTIWALGEGYAQFRQADPAFAAFLRARLDLAIGAVTRQSLVRYGQYQLVDGVRTPAWLIVDGADASAEAVLGLSAYVRAGGTSARPALAELARGIARLSAGSVRQWPYGALLPSALSRSQWHAWAAQMPSALAAASGALHDRSLLKPAVSDAALFTPQLLTATGPDNGLSPTATDGSQIAYGADARVQALLAVGNAAHSDGLTDLAGVAAGWFFGQNPAGRAVYDPATGVTDDGVSPEGTVNLNSGAESTIHGLLTMLALDAHPRLAVLARQSATIVGRDGQTITEAEAATLGGPATVVTADPVSTGESQWSGGRYVQAAGGATLRWTLVPSDQDRLVEAVVNRVPGRAGVLKLSAGSRLGAVRFGGGGAQGVSAVPGALLPLPVARPLPAGQTALTATLTGGSGQLDALLLTPVVSSLRLSGAGSGTVLLSSRGTRVLHRSVTVAGSGAVLVSAYDSSGRLRAQVHTAGATVTVPVYPAGFTLLTHPPR
ncbi:hypothetical protein M6D93_03465 [Jatrophihabitans telluris]|uniref:Uncharacterized protein n=1 Tax=Jatrophihabitans telluris TaxID=2038343 RepID=A0ABY4R181_9ACTN|nr:hypothetical protein [Jatrophihabitans telluris]UQX89067.1 hypothetical protein M6D93_03465 [Jatrophihabitans telluris]